jgi:transcriptional regulator with GAF, ATPase, and Fis domain
LPSADFRDTDVKIRWQLALGGLGAFAVIYAVVVLGFVATTPDLGIRCLVDDATWANGVADGVVMRQVPSEGEISAKGPLPKVGDRLVRIGDWPINTFVDFTHSLMRLRSAPSPMSVASLPVGSNPSAMKHPNRLPALWQDANGTQFVEIEFIPEGATIDKSVTCYLQKQSLPLNEVLFSLFWFVLQVVVFAIGAAVYWNRPFDRASQLFYALCLVTLGAFLGTNHWWIVAGSFWLTAPSLISTMLLPAVCLHFFLVFPRTWLPLVWRPRTSLALIYGLPIVGIIGLLTLAALCSWLPWKGLVEPDLATLRGFLVAFRFGIYASLVMGGTYFLIALGCVQRSYMTTRNAVEQIQLKLLWRAGLVTTLCMIVVLYMALFDREKFALGSARFPIFLAGLCFTVAYAYGIIRYRLLLVDQIVSKGVMYYLASSGLTAAFALTIALGPIARQYLNIFPLTQQSALISIVLMLAVILLLWLRDAFQGMIDRRFYREKYQLGKALERMNRAVGHLADPEAVAELMLASCRDVLGVDRSALYLRTSAESPFRLVAAYGAENLPRQFSVDHPLIEAVKDLGNLQRALLGARGESAAAQNALRELRIDLVHGLQIGNQTVGLVVLGAKLNSAPFSGEDLTFLNALGQITNVALYTVKSDRDLQRLNDEMLRKIERIETQSRQIAVLQTELSQLRNPSPAEPAAKAGDLNRSQLKGKSAAIDRVLETVRKVAGSESSVLVHGESGTGKELVARVLHENSPRRGGPLVCVHSAALSPSLLESELFGHVKGAFTGAHRDRIGRFQAASGGTLFLDEIGDISLDTQIKLLRVLQERKFEPVGGTQSIQADVRVIAATHQDLEKLIAQGRFREDLFYRLNVIGIVMPPLRERTEDILELALHFLMQAAQKSGKPITHIEPEALAALERHLWPGNVRELENVIERAVVMAESDRVTLADLPAEILRPIRVLSHVVETKPLGRRLSSVTAGENTRERGEESLAEIASDDPFEQESPAWERDQLLEALRKCAGNKAKAARLLGIPRSTYFSKLKKHGIH